MKESRTSQLEQKIEKCQICKKNPVEIFQLDLEVCCACWQAETFISFADQCDIPEV